MEIESLYRPNRRSFLRACGGVLGGLTLGNSISLASSPIGESGQVEYWLELVSGAPGLTGVEKWLAGSTGMDIFVPRNTVVKAPFSGTVTGETSNGLVVVAPNGFSMRILHIISMVRPGSTITLGQPVARVNDPSLDQLHWPVALRAYAQADGYQHLDLSIASSPNEFSQTPGGGGNKRAFDYVYNHGGLPNNILVIQRTPGPQEGQRL